MPDTDSTALAFAPAPPVHETQTIPKVTIFLDSNGESYRRTYIALSADTVSKLRIRHQLGEIELAEEPLPDEDFRAEEMAWLHEHLAQLGADYPGQWIAIDGGALVAHGTELGEVYAAAAQAGHVDPFITAVPEGPTALIA